MKEAIAVIYIDNIKSDIIQFHYQDLVPQEININNSTYVNLLIELFTEGTEKIINKKIVKIKKNKNMEKAKKLCYCEPNGFELDTKISLNSININSKALAYAIDLIDYIKGCKDVLDVIDEEEELVIPEKISVQKIKYLQVPSELYVYDRKYAFVNRDDETLYYQNTQGGINNLEIKIDPNNIFTGLVIDIKDKKGDSNQKSVFEINRNDLGGITVKFRNKKKSSLRVYGESLIDYSDAMFESETVYDSDDKMVSNELGIRAGKEEYVLNRHDYLPNTYVDQKNTDYRIAGQDLAYLNGLTEFSTGFFKAIEKKLIG